MEVLTFYRGREMDLIVFDVSPHIFIKRCDRTLGLRHLLDIYNEKSLCFMKIKLAK